MRFLVAAVLVLMSFEAFAVKVQYSTYENSYQEYVNITTISCSIEEAPVCQQICGNSISCVKEEGRCTNCAGTNDLFMRILFTRAKENFIAIEQSLPQETMLQYLNDEHHILVNFESVYNFYKAWGSEEVRSDFKTFCPPQEEDPILIINVNEKHQPQAVAGVICSDKKGQSYVRVVQDKNLSREVIRLTN